MRYLVRTIEPELERIVGSFRSMVLTGPRQSGKTTLLKHQFAERFSYMSLESPARRAEALTDPESFLALNPPPLIIDEVQYAPDLISFVKLKIDDRSDMKGQYILTGSQNLLLSQEVTQVLSGRTVFARLWPLSGHERAGLPQAKLPWERTHPSKPLPQVAHLDIWQQLAAGGYPEPVSLSPADRSDWFESYVLTYLERDVRQIRRISMFAQFQSFLVQIALQSGQLLNLTTLSRKVGVSLNAVKSWLSLLEATYQVILVRPYFSSLSKRLVKSPKVYLTDTGLLCHLLGIRDANAAVDSPFKGAIMETAVAMELSKAFAHHRSQDRLWFWRTSDGLEVDFIVETPQGLIPVEVKSGSTPHRGMSRSIRRLRKLMPDRLHPGYVIHTGGSLGALGGGDTALPLAFL
ncbi:MAG: ATP-binding protein [Bacteroidota bacterium]|nr:ATP-binding protein [Bacteroidota bacterium]MDE2957900.1 ATP-binding protein [Bacteroidota bacterium]